MKLFKKYIDTIICKYQKYRYKPVTSIDFLKLYYFDKMLETNDSRWLLGINNFQHIKINFLNEQNNIIEQFFQESKGNNYKQYIRQRIEILILRIKYEILTNCIIVLCIKLRPDTIKIVQQWYAFDDSTPSKYLDSLENLKRQAKGLAKTIEIKTYELNKNNESKKQEYQSLSNLLPELTKHFGAVLRDKEITVREYLQYSNKMISDIKKQNEINGRRKGK